MGSWNRATSLAYSYILVTVSLWFYGYTLYGYLEWLKFWILVIQSLLNVGCCLEHILTREVAKIQLVSLRNLSEICYGSNLLPAPTADKYGYSFPLNAPWLPRFVFKSLAYCLMGINFLHIFLMQLFILPLFPTPPLISGIIFVFSSSPVNHGLFLLSPCQNIVIP